MWDANHPSGGQVAAPSASYAYDELDRLTLARQPFGGTGGGTPTPLTFKDDQDHLVAQLMPMARVTGYVFSDRDLLTREASEVTGATNSTYNEHGQLTAQIDARGILTIREVDELDHRVEAIDLPGTRSTPSSPATTRWCLLERPIDEHHSGPDAN